MYWKNWSTRDDVQSLSQWERVFGLQFLGLFVFAYSITGDRSPLPPELLFEHRGGLYAFVAIRLRDYAPHARAISPRWDTVAMPVAQFREMAEPFERFL
ncbi:MAG: HYExAFE family protein [Pirellulales bacterium]